MRFVDLGRSDLLMSLHEIDALVANEGGTAIATPIYASRRVHLGNKHSRRDDLQCLDIVVAELRIRIHSISEGKVEKYEEAAGPPSYVPWAGEQSDAAVGEVKIAMLSDIASPFYKRLGCEPAATAEAMHKYHEILHGLYGRGGIGLGETAWHTPLA